MPRQPVTPAASPAARALTAAGSGGAAAPAEAHAWLRHHRLWDVYYAVAAGFTGHQIWVSGPPHGPHRVLALALLAALAVWYVALGRRLILDEQPALPARLVFLAGTLVLLAVAAALVPASSLVLLALIPQAHQVLPTQRLLPTAGIMLALLATGLVPAAVRTGVVTDMLVTAVLVLALVLPNTIWIARVIAQSAGRADLIGQLRASQAEVARLSHQAGIAAERQRLAGDLHDTVTQGLSSVVMLVQSAEAALDRDPEQTRRDLALAARTARDNLAEARAVVAALTPAAMEGTSLAEAVIRLEHHAGTPTTVAVHGEPRPLPTAVEVVLLRAAQEALTNVAKHAAARQVTVTLRYQQDAVRLEVADDGHGFPPDQPERGYGLRGMRARAEQVAVAVAVDSAPGGGTTVRLTAPAPAPPPAAPSGAAPGPA